MRHHNNNSHLRKSTIVFVIGLVILVAAVALNYFINSRSATPDSSGDNSITFNFTFGNIKGILELDF